MLWLGVLPALAVVWIRFYVKEPEIWVENQRLQKAQSAVMKCATIRDLPTQDAMEHDHRLHVDG